MKMHHDIIVIGGGIAGICAAQSAARENLDTLVIEELAVGGQALLSNTLEDFPGLADPVSGIDFAMRIEKQARNFGVAFEINTVTQIEKTDTGFSVFCNDKNFTAKGIVLASGSRHKTLGIPGETEYTGRGVSYCGTCDGPFYKNRKVLVIGGGDTACEETVYLSSLTEKLTLIHRSSEFKAQRAVASRIFDREFINVGFKSICTEIRGSERVRSALIKNTDTGEENELPVDGIFIFIGSSPRVELASELEKDEEGYIVCSESGRTAITGFYAAGDVKKLKSRSLLAAAADGALTGHSLAKELHASNRN